MLDMFDDSRDRQDQPNSDDLKSQSLPSVPGSLIEKQLWDEFLEVNAKRPIDRQGLLVCPSSNPPLLAENQPETRQLMYYIDYASVDWKQMKDCPPVEQQQDFRLELFDQQIGNRFHEMVIVQISPDGEIRRAHNPFRVTELEPEDVMNAVKRFIDVSVKAVTNGKRDAMPSWMKDDGGACNGKGEGDVNSDGSGGDAVVLLHPCTTIWQCRRRFRHGLNVQSGLNVQPGSSVQPSLNLLNVQPGLNVHPGLNVQPGGKFNPNPSESSTWV